MVNQLYFIVFKENMCEVNCIFHSKKEVSVGTPKKVLSTLWGYHMQTLIHFFFCCVIQWTDCQAVGRDLVRLLQNVARIPEFEKLWRDMMLNPSAICPSFTGELCKMWK